MPGKPRQLVVSIEPQYQNEPDNELDPSGAESDSSLSLEYGHDASDQTDSARLELRTQFPGKTDAPRLTISLHSSNSSSRPEHARLRSMMSDVDLQGDESKTSSLKGSTLSTRVKRKMNLDVLSVQEAVSPRNSFILITDSRATSTSRTFTTKGFVIGSRGIVRAPSSFQKPRKGNAKLVNKKYATMPIKSGYSTHRRPNMLHPMDEESEVQPPKSNDVALVIREQPENEETHDQENPQETEENTSMAFEVLGTSGFGASAKVHRALCLDRLEIFALKSIDVHTQEKRHQLVKELETFCGLHQCCNIVHFHGAYYNEGNALLILEYMNRGSLETVVQKIGPLPERILLHIAKQMFSALDYLHANRQIHRDIKPGNILINRKGLVKITDFGLAVEMGKDEKRDTFIGTQAYMSPERIQGRSYDALSDIWAAGLVLHYCATGKSPVRAKNGFFDLLTQICEEGGIPPLSNHKFSMGFCDLVDCCLQKDPALRWSAEQLLTHDSIAELELLHDLDWKLNRVTEDDLTNVKNTAQILHEKFDKRALESDELRNQLTTLCDSLGVPIAHLKEELKVYDINIHCDE